MSDTPAIDAFYERTGGSRRSGRRDSPRVSVWYPSELPYARLETMTHGYGDPDTLPDGAPIAYLTISGIQIGGELDDLELLLAAATEALGIVRKYATELREADGS
jgi:hypothetical protein